MSTIIPQRDLRNRHAQIIERVRAGESFIVTRDGMPVADVTPHVPSRRPPRFRSAAEDSAGTGFSREETERWLADMCELRNVVDDVPVDPWDRGSADE